MDPAVDFPDPTITTTIQFSRVTNLNIPKITDKTSRYLIRFEKHALDKNHHGDRVNVDLVLCRPHRLLLLNMDANRVGF